MNTSKNREKQHDDVMPAAIYLCWSDTSCTLVWLSSDTHGDPARFKEGEEREDKSILIQDKQHTEGGLHQPSRSGQNTSIPHETQSKKHG